MLRLPLEQTLCSFQHTKVPVMLSLSINVFELIQIENVSLCLRPLQGKPQLFGYGGDIWEVLCLGLRYAENGTIVLPAAKCAQRWLGLSYNLHFNNVSWFIWENKNRWNAATPTGSALTYLSNPYMMEGQNPQHVHSEINAVENKLWWGCSCWSEWMKSKCSIHRLHDCTIGQIWEEMIILLTGTEVIVKWLLWILPDTWIWSVHLNIVHFTSKPVVTSFISSFFWKLMLHIYNWSLLESRVLFMTGFVPTSCNTWQFYLFFGLHWFFNSQCSPNG